MHAFYKQAFSKQHQSNNKERIKEKVSEKGSNIRDKAWKKDLFISEQTVFHRILLIVKDMINILLYKYIYVYANVYKYSLKVI